MQGLAPKTGALPELQGHLRQYAGPAVFPRAAAWTKECSEPTPLVLGRARGVIDTLGHAQAVSCRGVLWPGGHDQIPRSTRGAAGPGARWPEHIVVAAGVGPRGLIPRGTIFEQFVHDSVEPKRSGTYEFCVVGVNTSVSGQPRYHGWEPTGHFDREFSFDEIDKRLALERYGRSTALTPRATLETTRAHRKEGASVSRVTRWPDLSGGASLVHGKLLPDIDERGRPVLPLGCRFPARNSSDILDPVLLQCKKRIIAANTPATGSGNSMLVLDGTGRFAARVQDEFSEATVVALDDPRRVGSRTPLKLFRSRCHFPVSEEGLDKLKPALQFLDGSFDVVFLPFVMQRLCDSDETRFLALVHEALRVASKFVFLAEDVVVSLSDESAVRRWKSIFHAQWSAPVVLDFALSSGGLADHFLSESGAADCSRRCLVLDASGSRGRRDPQHIFTPGPS